MGLHLDLSIELIKATVEIDQAMGEGRRVVGTGFLVSVPRDGAPPEVVLVTAAHVLEKMHDDKVRIGWRVQLSSGKWTYRPQDVTIRKAGKPLWVQHPRQDVAVMAIDVPTGVATSGIPVTILDESAVAESQWRPGEDMSTLGYPNGLAANNEGFPILRSGRLASWPVLPTADYPSFLLDLTAIPGNSGGPVFMTLRSGPGADPVRTAVTGVLTREVEQEGQRLELGLVVKSVFIRQSLDMLRRREIEQGKHAKAEPDSMSDSRTVPVSFDPELRIEETQPVEAKSVPQDVPPSTPK